MLHTTLEADNSSFGGGKLDVDFDPLETHPGDNNTKKRIINLLWLKILYSQKSDYSGEPEVLMMNDVFALHVPRLGDRVVCVAEDDESPCKDKSAQNEDR